MERRYTFFQHNHSSVLIESELDRIDTFEEFEKRFSDEMLNEDAQIRNCIGKLLIKHNIGAATLSKKAGLSVGYVGLLQNGKKTNPSRDILLKICIACNATIDETQELLKVAGCQPLYVRRKRDVIIWFGLKKGYNIADIDDELYSHNLKTLNKE